MPSFKMSKNGLTFEVFMYFGGLKPLESNIGYITILFAEQYYPSVWSA